MKNLIARLAISALSALPIVVSSTASMMYAQDFCNPASASVTQLPADLVARTTDGAAWISGLIDGGGTDLTFLSNAAQSRVLLTDPFVNGTISSFNAPLTNKFPSFRPDFPEIISAIAAIPDVGDRFFVVDPDFVTFSTTLDDVEPQIGIMNLAGRLTQGFQPIGGLPAATVISAVDVSPDGAEIALLDANSSVVFVIDSQNFAVQSFIPLLGFPTSLWRGGVAWGSCDTILAVSAFRDNFTSSLVLEYERTSGNYTGRSIALDNIAAEDGSVESVAIDVGFLEEKEVLYVYNAWTDDVYTVDLDFSELPGRVFNLACTRGAGGAGPVTLAWANLMEFNYDEIVVFQNDIQIASLPGTASSFTVPETIRGYSEFAVETRLAGRPNPLRTYCSDPDSDSPLWTPFDASSFNVGLDDFFALTGMDSTSEVTDIFDAKVLVLDSDTGGLVRTFEYDLDPLDNQVSLAFIPAHTIQLSNPGGVIVGYRGLALMEIDGVQRMAVSGVSSGGLPVGGIFEMDGSVFQFFNPIDTTAVGGPQSMELTDWSDDANGDLIGYDIVGNRLIRFVHDLGAGTMTAAEAAPAPQCAVYDCDEPRAAGAVTVLPNGLYVVTSGGAGDQSINRAHLSTPFHSNPDRSVKFVGQAQGLIQPRDFFVLRALGIGVGPSTIFGTCHTFFNVTDPDSGEPAPESVLFYTFPNMPGHPIPLVGINFTSIFNLAGASGHPGLQAEQLVDMRSSETTFTTASASAAFSRSAETLDYFYHVVNRGASDASLRVEVLLDGSPSDIEVEDVVIPPGLGIYRAAEGRVEKAISLRVTSSGGTNEIQVLIGTRAIADGVSEPFFLRGDVDGTGVLDINDPLANLIFQFLGQNPPTCMDAADTDDSGSVDISDPLLSLGHQFIGGIIIPLPGAVNCGPDPTPDGPGGAGPELGCESFAPCDG